MKRTPRPFVVPERRPVTYRQQVEHEYAERYGDPWQPEPLTPLERAWAEAERESD